LQAGASLVNDEPWLLRTTSLSSRTRLETSHANVRACYGRCVLTKGMAARARRGNWSGLEAAQIFPLAYKGY
jgi:hypothetical protein